MAETARIGVHRRQVVGHLPRPGGRPRRWLPWLGGFAAASLLAIGWLTWRPTARPRPPGLPLLHLQVALPAGLGIATQEESIAISPDGRTLVLRLERAGEPSRLWRRELASAQWQEVVGGEGGSKPFIAPRGDRLGLVAPGQELRHVPLAGGPPVGVATLSGVAMPSWGEDDQIYATRMPTGGIWRQALDGRSGELLTEPAASRGELIHLWPQLWPAQGGLLYSSWGGQWSRASVDWWDLASGESGMVVAGTAGRLVPAETAQQAVLVYVAGGNLLAARVAWRDSGRPPERPGEAPTSAASVGATAGSGAPPASGGAGGDKGGGKTSPAANAPQLLGAPVALLRDVVQGFGAELPQLAVSRADTLAVVLPPVAPAAELLRLAVDGAATKLPIDVAGAISLSVSPRSGRLALATRDGEAGDLWFGVLPVGRTAVGRGVDGPDGAPEVRLERLSFGLVTHYPLLQPDEEQLVVAAQRDGRNGLFALDPRRPGIAEPLLWPARRPFPCAFTPDGGGVVYAEATPPDRQFDLWLWRRGAAAPQRLTATPEEEWACSLSPDGSHLAFTVVAAGRAQVRVARFPELAEQWQVSPASGGQPKWSADGGTLWYVDRGRLMAVAVSRDEQLRFGPAEVIRDGAPIIDYEPLADSSLVLLTAPALAARATRVEVLVGWRSLLPPG